jgi:hypothetical protein
LSTALERLRCDGCVFENNLIDLQVICRSTIGEPHEVRIGNCRHLGRPAMAAAYKRQNPKTVWGKPRDFWFHDQFPERASTLDANVFRVAPHTLDGRLLFYPSNADAFVPFAGTGTEYDGLTNLELSKQKNVSVMGRSFDPRSVAYERLAIDATFRSSWRRPPRDLPRFLDERSRLLLSTQARARARQFCDAAHAAMVSGTVHWGLTVGRQADP